MKQGDAGIALCLSGGGFRAAAFHLGAVRRLNEVGLLGQVSALSGVSGGAIFLLHLAVRLGGWLAQKRRPDAVFAAYEAEVAVPFRRFLRQDLRTGVLVRGHLDSLWHGRVRTTERLAEVLEARLGALRLSELPERPRIFFNATNMERGVAFCFSRERTGDYQSGFVRGGSTSVALAAAVSAAYPPVFSPLRLLPGGPRLADGGVYDNLGLEPVWKSAQTVLVSDGGLPLAESFGRGRVALLGRTVDVLLYQNGALRKRLLFGGRSSDRAIAYWGLGRMARSRRENSEPSEEDVLFERVRTDLDGFSALEIAALENRGYLRAESALRRAGLLEVPAGPQFKKGAGKARPRKGRRVPMRLPHPQVVGQRVVEALRESARRRWFFIPRG